MVPDEINDNVVVNRISIINEMLETLRELPIDNKSEFFAYKHHVAAAESYLRRSLEALFDVGRHILAKKLGFPLLNTRKLPRDWLSKE